jgi:hypothetical protein
MTFSGLGGELATAANRLAKNLAKNKDCQADLAGQEGAAYRGGSKAAAGLGQAMAGWEK